MAINYKEILEKSTLSSSGWRRIFHTTTPLNPNSTNTNLDKGITIFLLTAFDIIAKHFKKTNQKKSYVLIARDSRPTGSKANEILRFVLTKNKVNYLDIGITSIPQCVVATKTKKENQGFIYLTASHNPPGYNGIKIGNSSGRIISTKVNDNLVKSFKESFLKQPYNFETKNINYLVNHPLLNTQKDMSEDYYLKSSLRNLGKGVRATNAGFKELTLTLKKKHYTIGCDFNGSARINSIDKQLFTSLGINFLSIGNTIGKFDHDIVPEGKSLIPLKNALKKWSKTYSVLFGYTVDCDGDRGNLAIQLPIKNIGSNITVPDAQTTFAFSVLAELCYTKVFYPKLLPKTCIVVNGPTSLRIDALCKIFNVKVLRAEVGEINVVTLANQFKKKGYYIPIIGEGSNGGSIIPPSTIRDPLCTALSLIKLLFLNNQNTNTSLKDIAIAKLKAPKHFKNISPEYFLGALLPYLNKFISTSVFEPSALLSIHYSTQKNFKQIYSELFINYWNKYRETFKDMNIKSYDFILYEKTDTIKYGKKINFYKESNKSFDGGFKVVFYSKNKIENGFIWFRFSKTEPVLRLSSEHENRKHQQNLFKINRHLLKETTKQDRLKNY